MNNVHEIVQCILKIVVVSAVMVVIFVGIPVWTYEMAYRFVARPWYKRHVRESRRPDQLAATKQNDSPV